ncbi:hypothetical protein DICPUDRAFT_57008 [Dictyostelium purpureum]|uniref:Potassium channel domain-containing protein n=1 Tax=Dictyostelium purpureum TaxID=5786 RepID=F0ZTW2_DICPU|nr:uncharacterized protein DICPUDRAFT_57008 [Dictyostelium purpureum]EGC32611.1 hypothetical protein DICPUDRAFT_57008 [Dictyostelium purpureum]|eukprot:XP_003290863.1 hypothetical protein DICPUDRAFT_57008 [Dictyostelium purpureum]
MLGVGLMCIELETSWVDNHIEINRASQIIRILIFITSLFLVLQLIEYYSLLLSEVTHNWLTKRARGFRVTRLNVLKSTKVGPLFWLEILVCSLQPLPFISTEYTWYKDPKWGLFMWLRLYLFCRVLRDYSPIYKLRQHITKQLVKDVSPKFNWVLSLKYIISVAPILTYLSFTLVVLSVTGQILYVFEREKFSGFTFPVAFYISFLSMVTGWPTDTYDEYNPQTFIGRFSAIVSCVFGLLLLSFVIESFGRLTQATSHQRPVLNIVTLVEAQKKERDAAARLIQLVWRRWRWQKTFSISQNRSMFNDREADFCVKYIEYAKTLGRMRRDKRAIQSQCQETQNDSTPQIIELKSLFEMKLEEERNVRESLESKIKQLETNQTIILNQLNNLIQVQQYQIQLQQQQQINQHQQQQHPNFNNNSNEFI